MVNSTLENERDILVKQACKALTCTQGRFLKNLHYWVSHAHKSNYGLEKDKKFWIYNTLDGWAILLDMPKITIRRAIKFLREKGIISARFLSPSRRNRTLYYTINYLTIKKFVKENVRDLYSKNKHMEEKNRAVQNACNILPRVQGAFLKLLHYWTSHESHCGLEKDKKNWIYNTQDEWAKQLGTSKSTVIRAVNAMKGKGIISVESLSVNKRNRTRYYAIDYLALYEFVQKNIQALYSNNNNMEEKNRAVQNACKILPCAQGRLLKHLHYWVSHAHENNYGLEKDKKNWIYNTQDGLAQQLNISKSTVIRAINDLKGKGIISVESLSDNKRNRTRYYSINYLALHEFSSGNECIHEHMSANICNKMDEHMNINIQMHSNINISRGASDKMDGELTKTKPTIVQDMLKIFKEEFPKVGVILNKNLARCLVAAFKTKFNSNLQAWKRYLELLKTSSYLTSKDFKISISWVIKFFTIDRIRSGDLGVDKNKLPVDQDEMEQKAQMHIESLNETETCKSFRKKIIEKCSPETYLSYFKEAELSENNGIFSLKVKNAFIRDRINNNFAHKLGLQVYFCDNDKQMHSNTDISGGASDKIEKCSTKPTTVQDMLKIFKEEFPKVGVILNKNLARCLVAAFKTKFNSNLQAWKRYLELLKTSSYLTSKDFKISILWVIKFFTIDRIRAGELGVDENKLPVDQDEMEQKAQMHIESLNETETCKSFRKKIVEKFSPGIYLSWFKEAELSEYNGIFSLKVKSAFIRDRINNNFAHQLGLQVC